MEKPRFGGAFLLRTFNRNPRLQRSGTKSDHVQGLRMDNPGVRLRAVFVYGVFAHTSGGWTLMMTRFRLLAASLIAAAALVLPEGVRADAPGTIVDVAVSAGSFTTLVAAVKAAGLADTLSGPGPYTVFAPTDAAFAKLPPGTVESLLKPENKQKLRAILLYHVTKGDVLSGDLKDGESVKTLEGQSLTIGISGGTVNVGAARVVQANISASNGVIHVIDTVLIPK
jgi:uncharacterized surface protein with fasciclin (FAS1) repeats